MYPSAPFLTALANIVEAGRKERFQELFTKTSEETQKRAEQWVDWSMKTLEKDDRIMWFLKKARLTDKEFQKTASKDWNAEKGKRGGYANQTDPVKWLETKLEHYLSNAKTNEFKTVLKYQFKPDALTADVLEELAAAEKADEAKGVEEAKRYLEPGAETFLKINDKWEWQTIPEGFCLLEGAAMRHCGNKPSVKPGDIIISLREKVSYKGRELWKPHLTFISNNGVLGETKGYANSKPDEKFHKMIVALLLDPRITRIKGGGYATKNNFKLKDLSEENANILKTKKPEFFGKKVDLDELIERINDGIKGMEEYNESEDRWGEYLSDVEINVSRLDDDVSELVDELKELSDNWEDEIREIADAEFISSYYTKTNEVARVSIGNSEEEISEELQEELDELSEEDQETVRNGIEGYLSDDNKTASIGSDSDAVVLTLDFDMLQERVDQLKQRKSLTEKKPKSGYKLEVLKKALESNGEDVRKAAIEHLKDQDTLKQVALDDVSLENRRLALTKIKDLDFIKGVASNKKSDYRDKSDAIKRINDQEWLKQYVKDRLGRDASSFPLTDAIEKITDEAFAKEIFESREYEYKESALENITDKKYLQEQFKKILEKAKSTQEEDYTSDELLSAMIGKSDLDDAALMEVVQLPKGQRYYSRRDSPKEMAIKNIKDQNILKSLVTDPKVDDAFKETALKKITDQDLLRSVLRDEKAADGMKQAAIPNIKDQKFLIDWFSPLMGGKSQDTGTFVEEISEAVDDQDFLKKIIEDEEIFAFKKKAAFKKIKDKKWLKEAMDKDEDLKRWGTKHWGEAKLGFKENDVKKEAGKDAWMVPLVKKVLEHMKSYDRNVYDAIDEVGGNLHDHDKTKLLAVIEKLNLAESRVSIAHNQLMKALARVVQGKAWQ